MRKFKKFVGGSLTALVVISTFQLLFSIKSVDAQTSSIEDLENLKALGIPTECTNPKFFGENSSPRRPACLKVRGDSFVRNRYGIFWKKLRLQRVEETTYQSSGNSGYYNQSRSVQPNKVRTSVRFCPYSNSSITTSFNIPSLLKINGRDVGLRSSTTTNQGGSGCVERTEQNY
jgi:hypothetical protein